MGKKKNSMKKNTQKEYNKALASNDPLTISKEELEDMTKNAIKKFKSLT